MTNTIGIVSQLTNWPTMGAVGMRKRFDDDFTFAQSLGATVVMFDSAAPGGDRLNPVRCDQVPDEPWMLDLWNETINRFARAGIRPWLYSSPFYYEQGVPRVIDVTNANDVLKFTAILKSFPKNLRRIIFDVGCRYEVTTNDRKAWKPSNVSQPVLAPDQASPFHAYRYAKEYLEQCRDMLTGVEPLRRTVAGTLDLRGVMDEITVVKSEWYGWNGKKIPAELAHRVYIWLHHSAMQRLNEWKANGHSFFVYASDYRNNATYRQAINQAFGVN